MAGPTAIATQDGSADAIGYPVEEIHPIDDLQEVEEAIAFANEALNAAEFLEESTQSLGGVALEPSTAKLLNVAAESYAKRFSIPTAALEDDSNEHGVPPESKLKKVILYLYAIVERIFKAIFDFFKNQKLVARKVMPLTKQYIGAADSLSSALASKLSINDKGIMSALHIGGQAPKKVTQLFDELALKFEKQHQFSAVQEVIRLVSAAKDKNAERVKKEAVELHRILEAGFGNAMKLVDNPKAVPVINESAEGVRYYASAPMFGQNVVVGIIAADVADSGIFRYSCSIKEDKDAPLRVDTFPVLTPDEIRGVCRTALRVCDTIVKFSRDEELMQKALREATFLTSKESDKSTVAALRNIIAIGQNSYIVHLRFTARTMQALMRWCAVSIKKYESVGDPNG